MNKILLLGRLGKDPELRSTQGGQSVCSFSIATSNKYKDKSGEWKEVTDWHNIIVWGKFGEICKENLHKGSHVFIEGRQTNRSFDGKDGKKVHMSEVVSENIQFLDPREGNGNVERETKQNAAPIKDKSPDDDLPF